MSLVIGGHVNTPSVEHMEVEQLNKCSIFVLKLWSYFDYVMVM